MGPNCKIMLTHNIDVRLGLTNKSCGTVRKIVKSEVKGDPDIILVDIDSYSGKPIISADHPKLIPIKV